MTFDEYNTDTNYDNDKSSLEELVKIGLNEGKTSDEIKGALSPKWQKSKKIGEFDNYITKYSAPKAEEEKPVEKVKEETISTPSTSSLSKSEQKYINDNNILAEESKKNTLEDIKKDSTMNWEENYNSQLKRADAYKNIDDHYFEGLPTFIFRRYQNNEFGDTSTPEGKKDAKLRMAYFMINGLGTALSNASNVIKGRQLEESDYEKFKNSQMANGLQNRWMKNKADTEGAIKAVEKEFGNEQDARLAAEQFTRDQKANTYWNMMDQNKKIDALRVTKKIGDMLGGMDTSELANYIAGAALTGDVNKEEVIAIGIAKLAANAPQILQNLPEGNIKDMVMDMIGGEAQNIVAGIGGAGADNNNGGKKSEFDPGIKMNDEAYQKLAAEANRLSQAYYDGEITEEQFRADYKKLEDIMKKHPIKGLTNNILSADKVIQQNNNNRLNELEGSYQELNRKAKAGEISTSDYNEQYSDLITNAKKWGANNKLLESLNKNKMTSQQILKYVDKANKKKK